MEAHPRVTRYRAGPIKGARRTLLRLKAKSVALKVREQTAIGSIFRRKIGGGDDPDRPIGRGELIAVFHRIRGMEQPAVLVIQGARGMGKSDLLPYLQSLFHRRRSRRRAQEIDVRIDLKHGAAELESICAVLAARIEQAGSIFRRARCPRFRMLQPVLARMGQLPLEQSAADGDSAKGDTGWLVGAVARLGAWVGGAPVIPLPRKAGPRRWASLAWQFVAPTSAARWVQQVRAEALADVGEGGRSRELAIEQLRLKLVDALVEDLRHATRRRVLPIHEVAIFVDAYDHVEQSTRPGFLVHFARSLAEASARVMIVVACREQQEWTKYARAQADHRDYDVFEVSERVEIHRLQPLAWADRMAALRRYGVTGDPTLLARLAMLSGGLPVGLELIGDVVSGGVSLSVRGQELVDRLGAKTTRPPDEVPPEEWADDYGRVIAEYLVEGMSVDLKDHLRAAAILRCFDRPLMAEMMGDRFCDDRFDTLVAGSLIDSARSSTLLDSDEVYRARSFVRLLFAADGVDRQLVRRWHGRAADHFTASARKVDDRELAFELLVEALYHRLSVEPEQARADLFACFNNQLSKFRFGRCETLLRAAQHHDWVTPNWQARILALAGQLYAMTGAHSLAEHRLAAAKAVLELGGDDPKLAVEISLGLARCFRLQGRPRDARRECIAVAETPGIDPVAAFQAEWSLALNSLAVGDLAAAEEHADESERQLTVLLDGPDADTHILAARDYGSGPLPLKRVHIARLRVELARRRGNRVEAARQLRVAQDELSDCGEGNGEPGLELYMELQRAQLLRDEGDHAGAGALATTVHGRFLSDHPLDRRGAAQALECMARAALLAPERTRAGPLLEALAEIDPDLYPLGRLFGLFGSGELARLDGRGLAARQLYVGAQSSVDTLDARVQRWFPAVGLIELDRDQRPSRVQHEIAQFLNRPGVTDHPLLEFYAGLLQLRATGPGGEGERRARKASDRIVRREEDRDWEGAVLAETIRAMEAGDPLPELVFNLP